MNMNTQKTLYEILEISENASYEVIRAAYISLIKKYHPDSNPATHDESTIITEELNYAYSILSEHAKRSAYDAKLRKCRSGSTSTILNSSNFSKRRMGADKKFSIFLIFFCILIVIWTVLQYGFDVDEQRTVTTNSSFTNEKTYYHVGPSDVVNSHEAKDIDNQGLQACPPPVHGYFLKGGNNVTYHDKYTDEYSDETYAPLKIEPSEDKDILYLLKFRNVWDSNIEYQIFVHGDHPTIEVNLLCGHYSLTYATGTTWYGLQDLFGNETHYYKADDVFSFYHDENKACGQTLILYKVPNGNLSTREISADEF